MKNKLKDAQGETLVEVLASILICALSVALLFGSVMVSANIDRQAQELDSQYYSDLTKAERQYGVATTINSDYYETKGVIVKESGASGSKTINVLFYGTERLLSYVWKSPGGGGA